MRTVLYALIALLSLSGATARADEAGIVSFDVYVFDKSTLKPIQNAIVFVKHVHSIGSVTDYTSARATDVNGLASFFSFRFDTEIRFEIDVTCQTSKGLVRTPMPLVQLRQGRFLFQRDIYLTLPRNIHECIQQ